MSDTTKALIRANMNLVGIAVNSQLAKAGRRVTESEHEDLMAEVSKVLCECAARWPVYIRGKGGDVNDNGHFRVWALKRMKGSVIDYWRKQSPLTRRELTYSTEARATSAEQAAAKYEVSLETVQEAVSRREKLLAHQELSEVTQTPFSDDSDHWDALYPAIGAMHPAALTWAALIYLAQKTPEEARLLMGISAKEARALQTHVEYTFVSAVLAA